MAKHTQTHTHIDQRIIIITFYINMFFIALLKCSTRHHDDHDHDDDDDHLCVRAKHVYTNEKRNQKSETYKSLQHLIFLCLFEDKDEKIFFSFFFGFVQADQRCVPTYTERNRSKDIMCVCVCAMIMLCNDDDDD